MEKHIVDLFNEFFEMVPVTTAALRESVYQLRHQIFCHELGLWNPAHYPNGLEIDEYDYRSAYYLIRHRKTGAFAATTRLILADPEQPDLLFPTESHSLIDRPDILANVPRNQFAEVSRFCVSKSFKRRTGESDTVEGINPEIIQHPYIACEEERRAWPILTLALIACLNKLNLEHRTTHWFSMLEPPIFRLYSMFGIHFTPIGPLAYSYDKHRLPCVIQVPGYLEEVKTKNKENWDMLTDFGRFWQNGDSDV